MVRLAVKFAPNGKVVPTEALGGHPVLVQAAGAAVQRWRYEPAPQQTEDVLVFTFKP